MTFFSVDSACAVILDLGLPSQLRTNFFGPHEKQAYELFFQAASGALSQKLAVDKRLRAAINGFVAVLHTWTQKLEFHPHIHCLVPGAGLNERGQFVRVKKPQFLLYLPHLQAAFRQHLYRLLRENHWPVDPQVWRKDWGVHIQPTGSGISALKYLGAYVTRTAERNSSTHPGVVTPSLNRFAGPRLWPVRVFQAVIRVIES